MSCRADGRGFPSNCRAVGCISAVQQPAAPDPEAAFLPFWAELPDRAGWRMLVSPAFPRNWPPPNGRGAVVRYALAMRLSQGVADGAEMAAPWASSTLGANGGVVVERLSIRLQPLGVQGVRPLRSAEIALVSREQEVAGRLLAGGDQATAGVVRDLAWFRNGLQLEPG